MMTCWLVYSVIVTMLSLKIGLVSEIVFESLLVSFIQCFISMIVLVVRVLVVPPKKKGISCRIVKAPLSVPEALMKSVKSSAALTPAAWPEGQQHDSPSQNVEPPGNSRNICTRSANEPFQPELFSDLLFSFKYHGGENLLWEDEHGGDCPSPHLHPPQTCGELYAPPDRCCRGEMLDQMKSWCSCCVLEIPPFLLIDSVPRFSQNSVEKWQTVTWFFFFKRVPCKFGECVNKNKRGVINFCREYCMHSQFSKAFGKS